MTPIGIKRTYQKRILGILAKVKEGLEGTGFDVIGPEHWDDDEYAWVLAASPKGKRAADVDDDDDGYDIRFTICESEVCDGSDGGVNFALDVTTVGGRIIGGLTPYNYSPQCWVSLQDKDAIAERFAIMEQANVEDLISMVDEDRKRYGKR